MYQWLLTGLRTIIITLAAVCVLAIAAVATATRVNTSTTASASVYLDIANGKGVCSATHIGGGQFISAGHCVVNGAITVKTDKGATAAAEVLWANKLYDLALLRAEKLDLKRADLDCSLVPIGAEVTANGNPLGISFLRTRGTVLSGLQPDSMQMGGEDIWRDRIIADISIAPGSSGGGLFDTAGRLVGVVAGTWYGLHYAIVVPSPTVCRMLGR
jgi:serine protease Do